MTYPDILPDICPDSKEDDVELWDSVSITDWPTITDEQADEILARFEAWYDANS